MTAAGDPTVLAGERVRLRPTRPEDAAAFVRWADDPDFARYQWGRGPGRFADEAAVVEWWDLFSRRDGRLFVIEHEGRPVGFANYREWRPKPASCEIGIGIGERALWSKGLGRDALMAL
ncbi:MAG: N-acetyltransferase, partial [Lysobacteraceae bacterium]